MTFDPSAFSRYQEEIEQEVAEQDMAIRLGAAARSMDNAQELHDIHEKYIECMDVLKGLPDDTSREVTAIVNLIFNMLVAANAASQRQETYNSCTWVVKVAMMLGTHLEREKNAHNEVVNEGSH